MFDARGGSSGGGASGDIRFGLVVLGVVLVAFLAAFKGPDLFTAEANTNSRAERSFAGTDTLDDKLPGIDAQRFEAALIAFSPDAHQRAVTAVSHLNGSADLEAVQLVLSDTLSDMLESEAEVFAQIDVRYLDQILNNTRDALRRASGARSKWCKGATYASLAASFERNPELAALRLGREIGEDNVAFGQYSVDLGAILLEAGAEARVRPARYGEPTPQDMAALQGVAFSMIADPQIMSLMMMSQTGADPEEALVSLDVCGIGLTLVSALRTMPQGTKGRAWSAMLRGDLDSSSMSGRL